MSSTNGSAPSPAAPEPRTGKYLGLVTLWRGARTGWREVWLRDDAPAAAKVTVRRLVDGVVYDSSAVAHLCEHLDDDSPAWGKTAAGRLADIAAEKALRQAFPKYWREYTNETAQTDAPAVAELPNTETQLEDQHTDGVPIGDGPVEDIIWRDMTALTDSQREELDEVLLPLAEDTIEMLCIAANVKSIDELTQSTLPAFREALGAYMAGVAQ